MHSMELKFTPRGPGMKRNSESQNIMGTEITAENRDYFSKHPSLSQPETILQNISLLCSVTVAQIS